MELSYSPDLEDYHLSLAVRQTTGTYIDVGGRHPIATCVILFLYGDLGTAFVDPHPELAAL